MVPLREQSLQFVGGLEGSQLFRTHRGSRSELDIESRDTVRFRVAQLLLRRDEDVRIFRVHCETLGKQQVRGKKRFH